MLIGFREFDETWKALDAIQRHVDRTFEHWAGPAPAFRRSRERGRLSTWPPTNVFENKEAFVVKAEVPGLAESDVRVSVEDDALVVRGERKGGVPEGYTVHLREREPVAFTRKFPLPVRVDADAVTATLHEGVLTITLPKAKEALPRQIAVKAG